MNIKFVYDIPYVKQMISYILIPFLIFIIVCSIILLIYSAKHKDHENPIYKYRINLACLLISVLLVAVFLAILIGFSMALKKEIEAANTTTMLTSFVIYSPMIPVLALIILMIKIIKLLMHKPSKREVTKIENQEDLQAMLAGEYQNPPIEKSKEPVVITEVKRPEIKEFQENKGDSEGEIEIL